VAVIRSAGVGVVLLLAAACSGHKPEPAPVPEVTPQVVAAKPETVVVRDTVTLRDPEQQQQVARLEIKLLEKDAEIDGLQSRLEAAQQEVVRTLARSQGTASRAEAASGIAEAEIAIQTPKGTAASDVAQAKRMLQLGTDAFNQQNYGGALYLANQAKGLVQSGRARAPEGERSLRPGEKSFAAPVRVTIISRSKVREGPGPGFKVLFVLEKGAAVAGYSYTDAWIRVTDDTGRTGWVSRSMVSGKK
jgi:hypothetical protein